MPSMSQFKGARKFVRMNTFLTNKSSNSSQPKAGTPYRRSVNKQNKNNNDINLNSATMKLDLQKFKPSMGYKAKLAKSKTIN